MGGMRVALIAGALLLAGCEAMAAGAQGFSANYGNRAGPARRCTSTRNGDTVYTTCDDGTSCLTRYGAYAYTTCQ
jgi:hypothetical protein